MSQPGVSAKDAPPDEAKMVKKFRRAAAGIEEQLPSDLRTPQVLSQTCDYLFNEVVANASALGRVHHFVWDRTRAIRNDFTILQVSSADGLRCAVDCLERIARFHIVSLHQMAGVKEKDFQYDWQQDREQLDRTLVSLMQYYDDSRGKLPLPNEAEFRAYLIVFQLQDPDLEDRVQNWPEDLVKHPSIRKAIKLYAAAGNTSSLQGPLRPPATLPIAQQNWQRFWNLIASNRTSYLTACVAEINFNLIRRVALQALTKSLNQRATADFTTEELCEVLAFDNEAETEAYLETYNVTFEDRDDKRYADISVLKSRHVLPEPSPPPPKQYKSEMVEGKRLGRCLPAVISGMSFKEAQANGLVDENEIAPIEENMNDEMIGSEANGNSQEEEQPVNDGESLFMPDSRKGKAKTPSIDFDAPTTSIFGQTTAPPATGSLSFGKPSSGTFGAASGQSASPFGPSQNDSKPTSFNFLGGGSNSATSGAAFNPSTSPSNGLSPFAKPPSPAKEQSPFGASGFGAAAQEDAPKPSSGGFNFLPTGNTENKKEQPPTSLFSQPAKSRGPPKPFLEDTDDSPSSSPRLGDAAPTFPPAATAEAKPAAPTIQFTPFTPPAANEHGPKKTSFPSFGQPAEGATQGGSAPSFQPKPSTTSFAPPKPDATPPSQPPKPSSTPSFNLASGKDSTASARRGSGSDHFNKPAHPSPLAQSFTAAADSSETSEAPSQAPSKIEKAAPSSLFPKVNAPSALPRSKPAEPKQPIIAPEPDFATVISEIARSITLDPGLGLFDQYIDFYVGKVVTDVQETLYFERVNAQADKFRINALSHRYGKLWRELCRRKRLARQGRERRRRTQQRLLESRSQASETASIADSGSVLGRSQAGSIMGSKLTRQEEVDQMFQQSVASGRWSKKAKQEEQAKVGSKRPTSSHSMDSFAEPHGSTHKRLKSTSHVEDSGRVSKAPTSHPCNGALKRSSFRETLTDNPPVASTTKSNYFRLKALGRAHVYDLAPTHPRKRHHAEVAGSPVGAPKSPAGSPPQRASPTVTPVSSRQRQPSTSSIKSRKTAEDTDAVIGRARAAREALRDGGGLFHPGSGESDPLRRSTGSQAVYESPSLERARLEARLRASQSGTDFGSSRREDVPAYRLRESKFVPREQYGRAIDRAREMRESRSGSCPQSPAGEYVSTKQKESVMSQAPQQSIMDPSPLRNSNQPENMFTGHFQPHWPTAAPSKFTTTSATPFDSGPQSSTLGLDTFGRAPGTMQQPTFGAASGSIQPVPPPGLSSASISSQTQHTQTLFRQPETAATTTYQAGFARESSAEMDRAPVPVQANEDEKSDDDVEITNVTTPYANGVSIDQASDGMQSEHFDDDEDEGMQQSFGHANQFAALANGFEEDDEEVGEYNDESDTAGVGMYPGEYVDEDGDLGDEEDVDEDEEEEDEVGDEDDFDEDEDEDDEEDGGEQYLDPRMLQAQKPAPLATQSSTEEVIELSD